MRVCPFGVYGRTGKLRIRAVLDTPGLTHVQMVAGQPLATFCSFLIRPLGADCSSVLAVCSAINYAAEVDSAITIPSSDYVDQENSAFCTRWSVLFDPRMPDWY